MSDTDTVVDHQSIIVESEDECKCGMKDIIEHKRFHILFEIKMAQTALDKLLGQLDLIDFLLTVDDSDSSHSSENDDEDDI